MPSKPPPYPPLGPLATSISALHTGAAIQVSSWWTWCPQPTRCLYLQVIRPSQVFSDVIYAQWWEICPTTAELLGRRTRFFHGLGSSTRSSTFIARVHYSCTPVYLISWTIYLHILHTHYYDVMVGCWFTGQGKKGDCIWQFGNCGPISSPATFEPVYTWWHHAVFAYCEWSNTAGGNGLGTRLHHGLIAATCLIWKLAPTFRVFNNCFIVLHKTLVSLYGFLWGPLVSQLIPTIWNVACGAWYRLHVKCGT